MGIEVSDYIDVKARASSLGCNTPTGIAILPYNFKNASAKQDLCYEGRALALREVFQEKGIPETPLEQEGDQFHTLIQESEPTGWILPTIFVSYSLLNQNPHLVSMALNVISNYLTDWFKDIGDNRKTISDPIEFSMAVETKNKGCKKVKYVGPLAGLDKVAEIIREVNRRE